jgi:hypothetical protein
MRNNNGGYILSFSLVVFLLGFLLLSFQSNRKVIAQTNQTLSGHENHSISATDAAILTKAYRASNSPGVVLAEYFGRDAIQGILNQPSCVGIRVYFGKKPDGTLALVLVGSDATGKDLTSGSIAEYGLPCPPFCELSSELSH